MIVSTSKDAPSVVTPEPHRRELKVLISPLLQEGVEKISVGMTILPAGNSTSSHSHESEIEVWLIIQGRGKAVLDGQTAEVGPESVIFIPPNSTHQLINTGEEELRMFWVYTPPGAERGVLEGLQR
jgi:mannose-6-phosphate isomerase-like protein (cupin superfamily)